MTVLQHTLRKSCAHPLQSALISQQLRSKMAGYLSHITHPTLRNVGCEKKHRAGEVKCEGEVVYSIPLEYGGA